MSLQVSLLQEPVAAAMAFGFGKRYDAELLLVFDLGGGTFDLSLVDSFEGIMEVRGCTGASSATHIADDDKSDLDVASIAAAVTFKLGLLHKDQVFVAEGMVRCQLCKSVSFHEVQSISVSHQSDVQVTHDHMIGSNV
jgi:hypothetical protein